MRSPNQTASDRTDEPGRGRPRRRRVRPLALAALAVTAMAAGSCGGDLTQSGAPAPASQFIGENRSSEAAVTGGQIVYGVPAETSSFNPALATWASYSLTVARSVYDTLAAYDDRGEVQPYLAERFEHDADYRTWTVTLREGVSYTNGKPFTAESFVRSQQALKASPVLAEAFTIVDRWEVRDPRTFVVHTVQPWTALPHAMASQVGVAVDPDWLASTDITHPIGTGPFVVDRWDVNKEMVLKRNPGYWRRDERGTPYPYLDQVRFKVIVDETARVEALRSGEIDIMMQNYATPTVAQMLGGAGSGGFQGFNDKRFETPEDYVLLNTSRAPLNDLDARRALAHALDLDDYVKTVTGGLDEPAESPWKPGSPWYTDVDHPAYDPAEARRLVEAVKARNGGTFSITLLGSPSNESLRVQQYVQQQWAAVGIDARLETVPNQTKIIRMVQADYDTVLTQQFDAVHPSNDSIYWNAWNRPLGPLSLDFARVNDPALNAATLAALGANGPAEQVAWAAVARRQAELVPYVWLAHASRTVIASPRLVNVVRASLPGGRPMVEFTQGSHTIHQIWRQR